MKVLSNATLLILIITLGLQTKAVYIVGRQLKAIYQFLYITVISIIFIWEVIHDNYGSEYL